MQALQAATINSAALLKQGNIGQIKVGFLADIIAVEDDPLKDISLMENVSFVMKDGLIFKQENSH